jgi:hypothetical protein
MSKIFVLCFLLLFDFANAKKQKIWDFQYAFNLKKDKIATVLVSKNTKDKKGDYALKFRWTLYANQNLILLANYMGYPHQYILRKKRLQDRVQIQLLTNGGGYNSMAYALIVFSDFDKNKKIATMNVYIKDAKKRLTVNFKEPNR